jgi:hypothetical protein
VYHRVRAAGDYDVGVASSNHHHGFADSLGAGGTGGQAASDGAAGAGKHCDVGDGHVGLLFELEHRLHSGVHKSGPSDPVHSFCGIVPGLREGIEEDIVIDGAFARAEIDAEAGAVNAVGKLLCFNIDASLFAGLCGGAENEGGAPVGIFMEFGFGYEAREVVILYLGAEGCGKGGGVEDCGFINSAFAGHQCLPEGFDIVGEGAYNSEAGDDYPVISVCVCH